MAILGGSNPLAQMAILGSVFFCVFLSFDMMQGYSAQLYGPTLAADCEAALYATFTVCCLGAPAVVDALGSRTALCAGALCYAVLALASLAFVSAGAPAPLRALVVGGGAIVGMGASVLWTAQGRIMLAQQAGPKRDARAGCAFAIFWALFNLSAVVGGLATFAYFSRQPLTPAGEAPLFAAFAALIALGALGSFGLRRLPSDAPAARSARARQRCPLSAFAAARLAGNELARTLGVLRSPQLRAGSLLWLATGIAPACARAWAFCVGDALLRAPVRRAALDTCRPARPIPTDHHAPGPF